MKKYNKFIDFNTFEYNRHTVCCPSCGENFIHCVAVESITRDKEDSKTGTRFTIHGHKIKQSKDADTGNLSQRRGSVSLRFSCEYGCDDFYLSFSQHKGNMILDCDVLKNYGNMWVENRPKN